MTTQKKKQYIIPTTTAIPVDITTSITDFSVGNGTTEVTTPGGTPADDGGGRAKGFNGWTAVDNINLWED